MRTRLFEPRSNWIVCQIGAREHYAVARGLQASGRLEALITDAWVRPKSFAARFSNRLSGRYHSDIECGKVAAFTFESAARDIIGSLLQIDSRHAITRRNRWFQRKVADEICNLAERSPRKRNIFAYSYAARDIFVESGRLGWTKILGQIDPGPMEARVVTEISDKYGIDAGQFNLGDSAYWDEWREEVELADWVVVNSLWSKESLIAEGVREAKIVVVPLAYEIKLDEVTRRGTYSSAGENKLKVLFLGQAILRKGIIELIEAAKLLAEEPIEITVVGPAEGQIAEKLRGTPGISWLGSQPRSKVGSFYSNCDVFILPTHSDGFGITQYEALAHGAPIVASKFCGDVVVDGQNGIILTDVSAYSIASALKMLVINPSLHAKIQAGAKATRIPTPSSISKRLIEILSAKTSLDECA